MYQPRAKITFTNANGVIKEFKFFNDISIYKSYEQLTNKCTVVFPKKFQDSGIDYFAGTNPTFNSVTAKTGT